MSIEAVAWALKSPVEKSTKKFVLVCLANYSDEHGRCWPSLATLARDTAQDIKTVRANVRELCEAGYLEDTGKRVGQTQSVVVYRLRVGSYTNFGSSKATENGSASNSEPDGSTTEIGRDSSAENGSLSSTNIGTSNPTEIGTASNPKPYQNWEGNPTKNGSEALPKLVGRSVIDPSGNRQSTHTTQKKNPKRTTKRTRKTAGVAVPIPEEFGLTAERAQYAEQHLPGVNASALMETFRSTAKSKGWVYVDWDQHWQTLVRFWAPDSGHWSSGQYPRKPSGQSQQPMIGPDGRTVVW